MRSAKSGAGEAVGKPLAAGHPQRRAGSVALRELLGRNLRQAAGLHHFQPHRALVDDAEVAGKARRALGPQLHGIGRLRERAQRRLHLHLERELVLLRLVELDDEPAVRGSLRPGSTFHASTWSPCTRVTSPAPRSSSATRFSSPCMTLKSSSATWRISPG